MDINSRHPMTREEVGHEIGMCLGAAEADTLLSASQSVLIECVLRACICGDRSGKFCEVELCAAPGDVPVIDIVRDAKVVKGA